MSRWSITQNKKEIAWGVNEIPHTDDIEMSGFLVSFVVKYGADENGKLYLSRHPVFPTLRLRPNDTKASYQCEISDEYIPKVMIDGNSASEKAERFVFDGTLHAYSSFENIKIEHCFYPSAELCAAYELVTVTNSSGKTVNIDVDKRGVIEADSTMGCMAINLTEVICDFKGVKLKCGKSVSFGIIITGRAVNRRRSFDEPQKELSKRYAKIERLTSPLNLDTGNDILDTMFYFAKIRAGESIFKTKAGLLHSPGGYSYYAAVWCNDQAEYACPWFSYTGDSDLISASINSYNLYTSFMSDKYEPIPSSIIAEGIDYWNGAGDRGDAAMYLYGASHFALTCGDEVIAKRLWNAIKWCAEYCERKKNEKGVIDSDTDELENRFPSGNANLCTSSLCFAGLRSAAILAKEFGETDISEIYNKRAEQLKSSIEEYFGSDIHGFKTYRYYDGNDILRSWICIPLCTGILNRAQETVKALLSEYLMTQNGLLTAEGDTTVWDRTTLYGLRGIFASGYTDKAFIQLLKYSELRLLGERVPYAVEAYPEGGRRHLSAESALFCRIITEGILSMKPAGLYSFTFTPVLPLKLDHLYLNSIRAYGSCFDIRLEKETWSVINENGCIISSGKNGESCTVTLR